MTPRRTWSNVWEHFEKELVDVDGVLKAICKYCQLKLVTKSGTSCLRGHVANASSIIDRKRFQASMHEQATSRSDLEEELVRVADVALEVDATVILEMGEMAAAWRSAGGAS